MTRSILILSFAMLAVAEAANIDPRCSRYSQGMEAQVLPYLQDCRKFVICDMGGNGQVMSCPDGLYFDAVSHACSFDTVSCKHGELTGGTNDVASPVLPQLPVQPLPAPVQPQPLPVQPQPIPVYPLPLPVQPQPIPVPVQPPSVFPPVNHGEPIITVPLPVAPIEEQPQQQPDEDTVHLQSVCWDQSAGMVYPVANDCGLYVVCMGSNDAIVERCPKGLLYDAKQQRCDFAEATFCATPRVDGNMVLDVHGVDLSLRSVGEPDETEPMPYAIPVVPVEEIAHLPEAELMPLHQPLLMVPEPEEQPEAVVEYKFRILDNYPRCLARSDMTLTVELPHDTDCSKYLVCVGRVAIEKQCPSGQHWNSKRSWCDFASAAGCTL